MSLVEAQKGMTDLIPCNAECGGDLERYSWTQHDTEVVVKLPMPPGLRSKQVRVVTTATTLHISFAGQSEPVLDGPLFKPVKADECLWTIEDGVLTVTLFKTNLEYEEWWPHVCTTERQIDMKTLRPPSKHMRDLDDGARSTVEKMMFEQHQKRMAQPNMDELALQRAMAGQGPQ